MTKSEALEIVGGLSKTEKMPGYSYNIPADMCKRGSKLRNVKNSVCSKCYAKKGRYIFKNTIDAMKRRMNKMINEPNWIDAMIFLLKDEKYFRWFDSGDLQNKEMLNKIFKVCEKTPKCKHWLPTREINIVKDFIKDNKIPKNLNIRISSDFIGDLPKSHMILNECTNSTVNVEENKLVVDCPVTHNKEMKKCEEANCVKCWNKNIKIINYKKH